MVDANATPEAAKVVASCLSSLVHSNAGPTWIGEAVGGESERVCDLARKMTAAGTVTGLRPGEIARNSSAAWIMEALLDEILAVVDRAGIDLPEHYPRAKIYDHAWERYNKPSMLQHLEAGRATEIEALNGALVKKAKSLGIPTPVNATIAAIVRGIDAQRQMRSNNTVIEEAVMEALARSDPATGGGPHTCAVTYT
jgi:hypothetical protein